MKTPHQAPPHPHSTPGGRRALTPLPRNPAPGRTPPPSPYGRRWPAGPEEGRDRTLPRYHSRHGRLCGLSLLVGLLATWAVAGVAQDLNPRERIDFWQQNFTEVTPDAHPRVARAQRIFTRLVQTAGHRPGVEPRLHVIREDTLSTSLPIAIPDGWVVISQRVIDFCYRTPKQGDDRLAFVLAHEIAHHMENDFWHMKFFQALDDSQKRGSDKKLLREVRDIAALTDKVLAKELRADELGITYLTMAGFDPRAVLGDAKTSDFFHEWIVTLDPTRLGAPKAHTHPDPSQRVATVQARLRQVADQAGLFNLGLVLYQAGDYRRAALAFAEFRRYFPGREVHHNLGTAYHQLALQQWRPLATKRGEPLFQLSVAIDPLTRAYSNSRGSPENSTTLFERHITAAIEQYQVAINQDSTYLPTFRNLASAYIVKGEPYKAIALLQDALKFAPKDAAVLNNLGVAFFYAKNSAEARNYLAAAVKADPAYDAPVFNLATLAHQQGDAADASHYWKKYLERDANSDWAMVARTRLGISTPDAARATHPGPESLAGLEIGAYDSEVPASWGKAKTKTFPLETVPTRLARYPNGLITVSQGDEIRQIVTSSLYGGASGRGVKIGQKRHEVEARYGAPGLVLATTTGANLMYPHHGITFTLQDDRVTAWLLYWD